MFILINSLLVKWSLISWVSTDYIENQKMFNIPISQQTYQFILPVKFIFIFTDKMGYIEFNQ